jgi:hypothetical protein
MDFYALLRGGYKMGNKIRMGNGADLAEMKFVDIFLVGGARRCSGGAGFRGNG